MAGVDSSSHNKTELEIGQEPKLIVCLRVHPDRLRGIPSPCGFKFRDLAAELRNKIYDLVLADREAESDAWDTHHEPPPFVNTCALTRKETLGLWYSTHQFSLDYPELIESDEKLRRVLRWVSSMNQENAALVRRMSFRVDGRRYRKFDADVHVEVDLVRDLGSGTTKATATVMALGPEKQYEVAQASIDHLDRRLRRSTARHNFEMRMGRGQYTARLYLCTVARVVYETYYLRA